jgi:acyl-CoA synthetase (AMP-forming)/AMP-acid ligase II
MLLQADLRDLLLATLIPILACTAAGVVLCLLNTRSNIFMF